MNLSENSSYLIVGLGNPDPEYQNTRHNFGFLLLDHFCEKYGDSYLNWRNKFGGKYSSFLFDHKKVHMLYPLSYMNRSGYPVRKAQDFFHLSPKQIIVLHDDLDLEFGRIKVKMGGGAGGHKGLRSLFSHLGTRDFIRVRLGIGRPKGRRDVSSWVLSRFNSLEKFELWDILDNSALALNAVLTKG
nr:aminoacyl-tRNA hydrolase [Deltaproteobacteria bacterium]